MKTIYELFQFIGEQELHIESLRQKLVKHPSFESYNCFRILGGRGS